jgi:hypothetical protein
VVLVAGVALAAGALAGFVANFAQEVMQEQLSLSVGGLRGQGIELFGRSEAFVSLLDHQLSFLDHVHEFNADQGVLGCIERFEPQHRPCHPLDCSMILLNGMITNDKFCLIRQCQVQLRWSRRPYRFRPHTSDYLLDESHHREGSHETPLADTSAIRADGGWGTAMGSGVSISPTMDDTERAVCRALTNAQTTDGGNV